MNICIDPQVEPKQEKFKLQEATLKVKVEDEKIQEIVVGFSCCFGYLMDVAGCLHAIQICTFPKCVCRWSQQRALVSWPCTKQLVARCQLHKQNQLDT